MADFTRSFDVALNIYQSVGAGSLVGFSSSYTTIPHVNTGNKIRGFVYDATTWKAEEQFNTASYAPTVWDPKTSNLDDSFFQSGIGDAEDLEVLSINEHIVDRNRVWFPTINHGGYYHNRDEDYMLSDDSVTQFTTLSGVATEGGANVIELTFAPKDGIPVLVRQYAWDQITNSFDIYRDFQKQLYFTGILEEDGRLDTWVDPNNIIWANVDNQDPEYLIDTTESGVFLYLNDQYNDQLGLIVPNVSGLTVSGVQRDWDSIGTATGEDFEEFHLTYSPVDRTQPAQLLIDTTGSLSIIELTSMLTSGVFDQAQLDYDLGIVTFGDSTIGGTLASGDNVYAAYNQSVAVEYEPENSRDFIDYTPLADTNPIRRFSDGGFIFIDKSPSDVTQLTLSADLPELSPSLFGPVYIGNEYATLIAEAIDGNGLPVEAELITFEIIAPIIGSFSNSDDTVMAITNAEGIARTLYNTPRTLDDLGVYTNNVTVAGFNATVIAPGFFPREDSPIYLYQVQREDSILGIAESGILSFYENYIVGEEVSGPVLTFEVGDLGDYSWITGAYADLIKWEIFHRLFNDLPTPVVYDSNDITTGSKKVLITYDAAAINPHTGSLGAFIPVQPDSFTVTSTGTSLLFNPAIESVTATGYFKSYFVTGGTEVSFRATAYNERLGRTIYSNVITVNIDIPDTMNGLIEVDTINEIQPGVLGDPDYYDQLRYDLDPVTISAAGVLPLGFRLRGRGATLASALGAVTFFDINAEIQFVTTPALRHEFRVDI